MMDVIVSQSGEREQEWGISYTNQAEVRASVSGSGSVLHSAEMQNEAEAIQPSALTKLHQHSLRNCPTGFELVLQAVPLASENDIRQTPYFNESSDWTTVFHS